MTLPNYEGPAGWRAATQAEVSRVEGYGVLKVVPASHFYAARRQYGDKVTQGHLVCAFKVKWLTDGELDQYKSRLAVADKADAGTSSDFFSGCADGPTDKFATQLALDMGGVQHSNDITAAYYQGRVVPLEQGGRRVYVKVCAWLSAFGEYPMRDADGNDMMIWIDGNMPGLRSSGRTWEVRYDAFLLGRARLTRTVYDPRCFYRVDETGVLVIHVHVDDSRITASSEDVLWEFERDWEDEFNEPADSGKLSEHFVGVTHRVVGDTAEMTVGATIDSLADLVALHPFPSDMTAEYPLSPQAPAMMIAGPTLANALVPDKVQLAQTLVGTLSFIGGVRYDILLATRMLSRHVSPERLTRKVFLEVLRTVYYVLGTRGLALTLRRRAPGSHFEGWLDSSLNNTFDGRAFGGFCLGMSGSGAILCSVSAPSMTAEASGVTELNQLVLCTKATTGLRILYREISDPPLGPTNLFTDAQVLVDISTGRKVSRESKWVAPRLAMVRYAVGAGTITVVKVPTADNRADIFTKPLTGAVFEAHRASVLGLRG